jgi:hypothetical protein
MGKEWENRYLYGTLNSVLSAVNVFLFARMAIRVKVYDRDWLPDAPDFFKHANPIGKEFLKKKKLILYR